MTMDHVLRQAGSQSTFSRWTEDLSQWKRNDDSTTNMSWLLDCPTIVEKSYVFASVLFLWQPNSNLPETEQQRKNLKHVKGLPMIGLCIQCDETTQLRNRIAFDTNGTFLITWLNGYWYCRSVSTICLQTCYKTPTPLVNYIVNDALVHATPRWSERCVTSSMF